MNAELGAETTLSTGQGDTEGEQRTSEAVDGGGIRDRQRQQHDAERQSANAPSGERHGGGQQQGRGETTTARQQRQQVMMYRPQAAGSNTARQTAKERRA